MLCSRELQQLSVTWTVEQEKELEELYLQYKDEEGTHNIGLGSWVRGALPNENVGEAPKKRAVYASQTRGFPRKNVYILGLRSFLAQGMCGAGIVVE